MPEALPAEQPSTLTRDEAIAAVRRCAFECVPDPEEPSSDDGRRLVHNFLSFIGCDWDEATAIDLINEPDASCQWGDTVFGRCLMVEATSHGRWDDGRRKLYVFDTVTPEQS